MRKILILSLLFTVLAVPVNGEAQEIPKELLNLDEYRAYLIQSFGWKCNKVQDVNTRGDEVDRRIVRKIVCEDGLVYYKRTAYRDGRSVQTLCHKGKCKKLE